MDVPEVPLRAQDCRIGLVRIGFRVRGMESSTLLFCHGLTSTLKSLILLCGCRATTLRSGAGSVPVTWRRLQNTCTSSLQVTPNWRGGS